VKRPPTSAADPREKWRWLRPPPGVKVPPSGRPAGADEEDDEDLLGLDDGDGDEDSGPGGDDPD
jgi:hypothetical protein